MGRKKFKLNDIPKLVHDEIVKRLTLSKAYLDECQ